MKKLLSLGVATLFIAIAALALAGSPVGDVREAAPAGFIGAWRLASLEEEGADGKVHQADASGMLVFTADGHMSVQVMYRNPESGSSAAPVQYAQGGYEASYGTYQIEERAHTFTFHVEGALVRKLVGKDLPRAYELAGKQLIVKSSNPDEHWRVTWEHF